MTHHAILDPDIGAALVETAGSAGFGPLLLHAAQRLDDVCEVFGYRLAIDGRPRPLLSCSEHADAADRADEYVARFYRNDPALWARRGVAGGGFTDHVHAGEIALRDYRAICFDRPRFADKLCFGWRDAGEEVVLSFYRRRGGALQSAGLAGPLGGLANVALTALARMRRPAAKGASPPAGTVDAIEQRLDSHFPSLSRREREVCARTLAGRTAAQIGDDLGLSAATVLTYRQRAYGKLGVKAANELVPIILH